MKLSDCKPYFHREVLRLDEAFNKIGLHPLLGQEIEFDGDVKGIDKISAQKLRAKIFQFVDAEIAVSTDAGTRAKLQAKRAAVETFNPHDLIMFSLLEMNPKTRDYLKPAFGYDEYTDNPNVYELRLCPLPPAEWLNARETVLHELRTLTDELHVKIAPRTHLSISLNEANGNIFSLDHPTYPYLAGQAIEGMARAVYDAEGMFIDPQEKKLLLIPVECTPSRSSPLRIAKDRVELRISNSAEDFSDLARAFALLSGAHFGIMRKAYEKNSSYRTDHPILPHETRFKPIFIEGTNKGQPDFIKHLLGGAVFDSEGKLQIDKIYLNQRTDEIGQDLLGRMWWHLPRKGANPDEDADIKSRVLKDVFSNLRIGQKDGMFRFLNAAPRSAEFLHMAIDAIAAKLNKELPVQRIIEVPVISPGYHNVAEDTIEGFRKEMQHFDKSIYPAHFQTSPVFRRTTPPEVFELLSEACRSAFGSPTESTYSHMRKLERANTERAGDLLSAIPSSRFFKNSSQPRL